VFVEKPLCLSVSELEGIEELLAASGSPAPIPLAEVVAVSRTTFKVLESLRRREALVV
jgi:hypothetical protein